MEKVTVVCLFTFIQLASLLFSACKLLALRLFPVATGILKVISIVKGEKNAA